MEFALPFNSQVKVRLFHPLDMGAKNPCHRVWDVFGLRDESRVDAVTVGGASRFLHPDVGTAAEIKAKSDAAASKKEEAPAPSPEPTPAPTPEPTPAPAPAPVCAGEPVIDLDTASEREILAHNWS